VGKRKECGANQRKGPPQEREILESLERAARVPPAVGQGEEMPMHTNER